MKTLAYLLKLLLIINPVFLPAQSGNIPSREIVDKSEKLTKFTNVESLIHLTIFDNKGRERVRKIRSVSGTFADCDKSLLTILEPPEVAGIAMLVWDFKETEDDMWIYMPALRKSRRIVSSEKKGSFMGSEFTNADLATPNLDDFTYEKTGEETVNGTGCYKIRGTAVNTRVVDEYGYLFKILYIGKDDFLTRKMEYYNTNSQLYKTMHLSLFNTIPGTHRMMAGRIEMTNHLNQRRSVMVFEQVKNSDSVEEDYFTVTTLEK